MNMTKAEIMKLEQENNLPDTIEDLNPMSIILEGAVEAYNAKINIEKNLNVAESQRQATIEDGQKVGKCLLVVEAKIGKLSQKIEQEHKPGPGQKGKQLTSKKQAVSPSNPKHEKLGLTKAKMHTAQAICNHPEAVEEAIARAKENDTIPTKSDVIKIIAANKREEKKEKEGEQKPDINKIAYKMAREMDGWFNSFNKIIDDWDSVSPENKEDLGRQFIKLNMIFTKMKKNTKPEEIPLLLTKE
jgi:hypothetical protein